MTCAICERRAEEITRLRRENRILLSIARSPRRVLLTPSEIAAADVIAETRQSENLVCKRPDRYGAPREYGLALHQLGARCEAVVAKYFALPHVKGDLRDHDVGRYQVRGRSHASYDLILHKTDPDGDPFILVIGPESRSSRGMIFVLHGWIYARDGKQAQWWSDPAGGRPAYFVPKTALRPIDELRVMQGMRS